ncbi:MAG: hypothetical protein FWE36_08945 [Erysipelotrichales bacterium]|nr:hypothetical protein [Erysipelotrichales bacterium]
MLKFASFGIEQNGDYATATIKLTAPLRRGVNFGAGIRFTASTQDEPYGTINNGIGPAGSDAGKASYFLGSDHFEDSFRW